MYFLRPSVIKGVKSVMNAIAILANEGLHLDGEQPIYLEGSTFGRMTVI
jgi:hypothetical protein